MKYMNKKTIVITGSGSGLGKMATISLAKRGHFVYATTMYQEEADSLNEYASKYSLPIKSFKLDITSKEDREKLNNIDFDTVICNAAIGDSGSVAETDVDRYRNVFETNVFSNIAITQVALAKFIPKRQGRVIFLSSLAGRITIPFLSPYTASKFSIEAFAMSLRKELKKLKNVNIDVCLIEPGAYATGFNKENNEKKYTWMEKESYFKNNLNELKINEEKYWNFIESKNFNSIVKKYIKAVEVKNVKKRYTAPFIQAFLTQLGRIFGM